MASLRGILALAQTILKRKCLVIQLQAAPSPFPFDVVLVVSSLVVLVFWAGSRHTDFIRMGVETRNIFWGDYQLFDTNILCFDASNFSNLMVSIGS